MKLNPCRFCGSEPWEIVRGELREPTKEERENNIITRENIGWVPQDNSPGLSTTHSPTTAPDVRIVCSKCHERNTSGWTAASMLDYTQFCWNRDNPC